MLSLSRLARNTPKADVGNVPHARLWIHSSLVVAALASQGCGRRRSTGIVSQYSTSEPMTFFSVGINSCQHWRVLENRHPTSCRAGKT